MWVFKVAEIVFEDMLLPWRLVGCQAQVQGIRTLIVGGDAIAIGFLCRVIVVSDNVMDTVGIGLNGGCGFQTVGLLCTASRYKIGVLLA